MSDHLDECPEVFIDCYGSSCDCDYAHICMCRELRACEERVRGEEQQRIEAALKFVGQHDASWELAVRDKALREAREAVAALATERELRSPSGLDIDIREALAAIDALREGEKP